MWNCSPGTGELELHQRGDETSLCSKVLLRGAVILKTQKAIEASWANSNFSKKQTAATPVLQIRKYLFSRVLRDFVGGKNKM